MGPWEIKAKTFVTGVDFGAETVTTETVYVVEGPVANQTGIYLMKPVVVT